MSERENINNNRQIDIVRQRDELEQRTDTLQTKDGADDFVRERLNKVNALVGKCRTKPSRPGRISMGLVVKMHKRRLERYPQLAVLAEATRLKRQKAMLEKGLAEMESADKEVYR